MRKSGGTAEPWVSSRLGVLGVIFLRRNADETTFCGEI